MQHCASGIRRTQALAQGTHNPVPQTASAAVATPSLRKGGLDSPLKAPLPHAHPRGRGPCHPERLTPERDVLPKSSRRPRREDGAIAQSLPPGALSVPDNERREMLVEKGVWGQSDRERVTGRK